MKPLEEFKTATVYALAKDIGTRQTQAKRWLDNNALVTPDGRVYIETIANEAIREKLSKLYSDE